MIAKEDLIDGRIYHGEGRLGPFAMWRAEVDGFVWFDYTFGVWTTNEMDYGERGFAPKVLLPELK